MSGENNTPKQQGTPEQPKHESWIKHVIDEIKEEIEELTEEAQNMDPNDFPVVGDGHLNIVHDHHHDHDKDKKAE